VNVDKWLEKEEFEEKAKSKIKDWEAKLCEEN
jgi:hypothetical protein